MTKSRRRRSAPTGLLVAAALATLFLAPAFSDGAPPLSDADPVLAQIGQQVQDQSRPEAERLELIVTLGKWGTDQVRAPLLAVLTDPLPSIRAAAARALGWKGNRAAVAGLRQRVESADETPAVKAAALEALGRIGDESARDLLLSASRDPDPKTRGIALWGLTFGNVAGESERVPLLRQLAGDDAVDPFMRCQAIQALGALKDTGSVPLLMRLVEREPPFAMPTLSEKMSQPEIMMVRYREARDVKAFAVQVLGMLDARAALPLILKTAEDPADYFLRAVSVETLGAWKVPEAQPVLLRRLEDPFEYARAAALVALAKLKDPTVVDQVAARLSDKAPIVRLQAVNALAELGDSRVRPQLEALQQKETDANIQIAVDRALTRLAH